MVSDLKRHVRALTLERNSYHKQLEEAEIVIGILLNQRGGKANITEKEIVEYDGVLLVYTHEATGDRGLAVRTKEEARLEAGGSG